MDTIFALIKIFYMKLNDVANGVIEHEEARGLFYSIGGLGDIH